MVAAALVAAAASGVTTAAGAGATVTVKDNRFSPSYLSVTKGARVLFVWKGKALHDVKGSGPASFCSSLQSKGSFSVKLTKKGTYGVVCTVHPGMRMTLKVR